MGSSHFALVQYEGLDTYNVIRTTHITKNKEGQTVAKYGGSKYLVTVLHNNSEVVVQDLAYNLNNKYPIIDIKPIEFTDKDQIVNSLCYLEDEHLNEQTIVFEENFVNQNDDQYMVEHFQVEDDFEQTLILQNEIECAGGENTTTTSHLQQPKKAEIKNRVTKVDMRNLTVPNSSQQCKKYFCIYCKRQVTNFGRHLVLTHKNEEDVLAILKYPKEHPTRSTLIGKIRKKGQFLFNTTNVNSGMLMVCRRPSNQKQRTANHFLVCPHCKDMYSKLSLRVHVKKCLENTEKGKKRNCTVESRACVINIHPSAKDILAREVLPKCRKDHITELISFDELCVLYGNKLISKYKEPRHYPMIRSRLRSIGTFLDEFLKSHADVKCLMEILDPSNYELIVDIINRIAGLDEKGRYKAPSTAYNLGLQLKSIVTMYESHCIKNKSTEKRVAARDLLTLMNDGFQVDINKTVLENQSEMKRQKKVKLPTKEDILALKRYLNKGVQSAYSKLSEKVSLKNWKKLAGFTLVSLQLFNRRRAGELERILIKDFHSYEFVNENDEAYQSLPPNYKQLASLYARFFIRGKLNRQVPVLVNRDMINYINVLLKHKEAVGVLEENPYVFGTPGSFINHLRACDLMRKYSVECGAPNPDTLRGTELRKQIATACSLYNLPDLLVDDVAKHLGHHLDIHKNIYRQSTVNQIPSMVNILRKALGDTEEEEEKEVEETITINQQELPQADPLPETIIRDDSEFELDSAILYEQEEETVASSNSDNDYVPSRSPTPEIKVPKKRTSWSDEEKGVIFKSMNNLIKRHILPTYQECLDLKSKSPCLDKRTPPQIKAFVAYQSKKMESSTAKVVRSYWSSEEKKVVRKHFQQYLDRKTLPSLPFCKQIIAENPVLKLRTPEMLKAYVNNANKKLYE